jgi:hypothetical protein
MGLAKREEAEAGRRLRRMMFGEELDFRARESELNRVARRIAQGKEFAFRGGQAELERGQRLSIARMNDIRARAMPGITAEAQGGLEAERAARELANAEELAASKARGRSKAEIDLALSEINRQEDELKRQHEAGEIDDEFFEAGMERIRARRAGQPEAPPDMPFGEIDPETGYPEGWYEVKKGGRTVIFAPDANGVPKAIADFEAGEGPPLKDFASIYTSVMKSMTSGDPNMPAPSHADVMAKVMEIIAAYNDTQPKPDPDKTDGGGAGTDTGVGEPLPEEEGIPDDLFNAPGPTGQTPGGMAADFAASQPLPEEPAPRADLGEAYPLVSGHPASRFADIPEETVRLMESEDPEERYQGYQRATIRMLKDKDFWERRFGAGATASPQRIRHSQDTTLFKFLEADPESMLRIFAKQPALKDHMMELSKKIAAAPKYGGWHKSEIYRARRLVNLHFRPELLREVAMFEKRGDIKEDWFLAVAAGPSDESRLVATQVYDLVVRKGKNLRRDAPMSLINRIAKLEGRDEEYLGNTIAMLEQRGFINSGA